jgi:2-succinyl-6-hydroxy-2,4-cyclohexadiene-1-carboxylate synthase
LPKREIVFIHGFLGDPRDWDEVIANFSLKAHCIAPSLSSIGELAYWGKSLPKGSHLVGYSMGGRIALWLHHLLPNHFGKSVVLSGNPGLRSEKERAERRASDQKWIQIIQNEPFDQFLTQWYAQALFAKSPIPKYRKEQNGMELVTLIEKFSIAKQPSFWDNLGSLILFLFGDDDEKYKRIGEEIKALGGNVQRFAPNK